MYNDDYGRCWSYFDRFGERESFSPFTCCEEMKSKSSQNAGGVLSLLNLDLCRDDDCIRSSGVSNLPSGPGSAPEAL